MAIDAVDIVDIILGSVFAGLGILYFAAMITVYAIMLDRYNQSKEYLKFVSSNKAIVTVKDAGGGVWIAGQGISPAVLAGATVVEHVKEQ